jgi:HEAT repeat protein
MVPIASTAVHALGLIGDARAVSYLARLALKHPNPIIREQAATAAARFGV